MKRKIDSDILLVDKPEGMTSFDVIRKLRKKKLGVQKTGQSRKPKLGHAGTLDPLASGLLIIGVGKGTKKLSRLIKLPKTYKAEILVGKSTTTGDREGGIKREQNAAGITREEVRNALQSMHGKLSLPVPLYSAVKVRGRPLYDYARKGEKVKVPEKKMEVLEINNVLVERKHVGGREVVCVQAELTVSGGTYIRSLAEGLGKRLGYPAMLRRLRRTRIGSFSVDDAQKINTGST